MLSKDDTKLDVNKLFYITDDLEGIPEECVIEDCVDTFDSLEGYYVICPFSSDDELIPYIEKNIKNSAHCIQCLRQDRKSILSFIAMNLNYDSYTLELVNNAGGVDNIKNEIESVVEEPSGSVMLQEEPPLEQEIQDIESDKEDSLELKEEILFTSEDNTNLPKSIEVNTENLSTGKEEEDFYNKKNTAERYANIEKIETLLAELDRKMMEEEQNLVKPQDIEIARVYVDSFSSRTIKNAILNELDNAATLEDRKRVTAVLETIINYVSKTKEGV